MLTQSSESEVETSLNQLYRLFQEEYIQNENTGQVSVVSHSHIVCNGSTGKKIVTLADLYLCDTIEVAEIRKFVTILPSFAKFVIVHYPRLYDVFMITWQNDDGDPNNAPT